MIILNPITLPASKFLSTMTTLIGDVRNHETIKGGKIVNTLVESCRVYNVDFGKGIVNNFKVSLQPVKDLTETSSALTITKPNVAQETILIDNYKFVPISLSEVLTRDAFLSGEAVNGYLAFVNSIVDETIKSHFYEICLSLYNNWEPAQTTQVVEIDQIDTSTLTGADLRATQEWNASEIAKVMRKTLNNMQVYNSNFTDIVNYTDANTGEQGKVVSCLDSDNTKIVFNDNYYTNFLADAMASLYHSDVLGEMLPGDNFALIPTSKISSDNELTIAWVSDKMKFAIADFYSIALAILDPSTMYRNSFTHFSYGAGVFKYMPGVKFIANVIQPS